MNRWMNMITMMRKVLWIALPLLMLFCISCGKIPSAKDVFYLYDNSAEGQRNHIVYDFDGVLANDSALREDYVFCRQQKLKGNVYYAVFPETNYVGICNGELEIRLFQHQQYMPSGIETSAKPLVALGEIKEQIFSHTCGSLQVSLRGRDTIMALRFTDNDTLDRLWGDYVVRNVGNEDQQLLALASSEGSNEVWLDCEEGVVLSDDTATTFTIMVPPGAFYRGFAMDVFSGDSLLYHIATENNCKISRGKMLRMPEIAIP